jgi:hypothetical protein
VIELAIVSLLLAADTSAGNRIGPIILDRDPNLPAVTYQRISTPRPLQHDGDQHYADFRLQLNCWAKRIDGSSAGYIQAKQLGGEVRAALHGYRGTAGGVTVGLIQITNDRDDRDPQREYERVSLDAVGNYQET